MIDLFETNRSHLQIDIWKMIISYHFLLGRLPGRCYATSNLQIHSLKLSNLSALKPHTPGPGKRPSLAMKSYSYHFVVVLDIKWTVIVISNRRCLWRLRHLMSTEIGAKVDNAIRLSKNLIVSPLVYMVKISNMYNISHSTMSFNMSTNKSPTILKYIKLLEVLRLAQTHTM